MPNARPNCLKKYNLARSVNERAPFFRKWRVLGAGMKLSTVLFAAAFVAAMSACTDGSTFIEGTRAKPAPAVVKANPSGDVSKKSASSENSPAPVNQGSNQLPAPPGTTLRKRLSDFRTKNCIDRWQVQPAIS
jgi:hypothetical protein